MVNESAENQDLIAFPEWTEYRKKNSLDPLGMQNSSVNPYQSLLPGISNVTLEPASNAFDERDLESEVSLTNEIIRADRDDARICTPDTAAKGDPVELSTTGVFQLPKASAAVLTVGTRVAWDNTAKEVTTPAAGRFPIGVAVEAAGNGITSVAVRLDGVATAAA